MQKPKRDGLGQNRREKENEWERMRAGGGEIEEREGEKVRQFGCQSGREGAKREGSEQRAEKEGVSAFGGKHERSGLVENRTGDSRSGKGNHWRVEPPVVGESERPRRERAKGERTVEQGEFGNEMEHGHRWSERKRESRSEEGKSLREKSENSGCRERNREERGRGRRKKKTGGGMGKRKRKR